jgi:hypothetical protein
MLLLKRRCVFVELSAMASIINRLAAVENFKILLYSTTDLKVPDKAVDLTAPAGVPLRQILAVAALAAE